MPYDYSKLYGAIAEKCGTRAVFAQKMGLSERSMSLKLKRKNRVEASGNCQSLYYS